MNLQELTGPLPKDWLNIAANSLLAKAIDSDSIYSSLYISNGNASVFNGATLNITAANLVNGIIGATTVSSLIINTPTASQINDFIDLQADNPFSCFKFTICASGPPGVSTTVNVTQNTGITSFNGANIVILPGQQKDLLFVQIADDPNWVIYF
jgi:hypothetical protein